MKLLLLAYKELKFIFQQATLEVKRSHHRGYGSGKSPLADLTLENEIYYFLPTIDLTKLRKFNTIVQVLFYLFSKLDKKDFKKILVIILCLATIIYNFYLAFTLFFNTFLLRWDFIKKVANDLEISELTIAKLQYNYLLLEIPEFYYIHQFQFFLLVFLWKVLFAILIILPVLLIIAYSTLLERKMLSAIQRRRGPNRVGIKGSTQPLIDGVKLILKEIIIPVQSESKIFLISSIWSIFFMLLLWFIIPTSRYGNVIQFNYELLALFCVSILGSISILLAGWSSNSKYAFLGGVWAGAQMISYELVLGLIVLIVMTVTNTTQIIDIVEFQEINGPLFLYLPLEAALFLVLIVAETNWAPFDFAEAESELVSGYNTEYSGLPFAFFFIAEYGNILYMSLLTALLFFGGWSLEFLPEIYKGDFYVESTVLFTKTIFIYHFFLWLRGALPRYRYDQLMSLCWKVFLPIVLVSLVLRILLFIY